MNKTTQLTCSRTLRARASLWTTTHSETNNAWLIAQRWKSQLVARQAKRLQKSAKGNGNSLVCCARSIQKRCSESSKFYWARCCRKRSRLRRRLRLRWKAWYRKWTRSCKTKRQKACSTASERRLKRSLMKGTLCKRTPKLIRWERSKWERFTMPSTTHATTNTMRKPSMILTDRPSRLRLSFSLTENPIRACPLWSWVLSRHCNLLPSCKCQSVSLSSLNKTSLLRVINVLKNGRKFQNTVNRISNCLRRKHQRRSFQNQM